MTLAEMVAQYGEAEVVRWAETGRKAEKMAEEYEWSTWTTLRPREQGGGVVYKIGMGYDQNCVPEYVYEGATLLAALEDADA